MKEEDKLKKELKTVDINAIKSAPENAGVTRTLFAIHILLNGSSDETLKIIANNFLGAWDFVKDKADKYVDKMVVFAKRNMTPEKQSIAQVIVLNQEFVSFVPDESFKPIH